MLSLRRLTLAAGWLCALGMGMGCDGDEPGEREGTAQLLEDGGPDDGHLAILAAANFAPDDVTGSVLEVALVNIGEEPVTLKGVPDVGGIAQARMLPAGGQSGARDSAAGRFFQCTPWDIRRVVGQDTLEPGGCSVYRWTAPGPLLGPRRVIELRIWVLAQWTMGPSGVRHTSRQFNFKRPVDRRSLPPGLPSITPDD